MISVVVGHDLPSEIVVLDLEDCKKQIKNQSNTSKLGQIKLEKEKIRIIKRSSKVVKDGTLDHEWISEAEEIEYPTKLAVSRVQALLKFPAACNLQILQLGQPERKVVLNF